VKPKDAATYLLEGLGEDSLPINPLKICKKMGVYHREDDLGKLDGMLLLDVSKNQSLICVNNRIIDQARKNFTTAHELGHFCMHCYERNTFYCSSDSVESFKSSIDPIELSANEFAAELLMPAFIYKPLIDSIDADWDCIKELANKSQTSLQSTAIRFVDLTNAACCLIMSKDRRIMWFRKSAEFQPFVQMEGRLLSRDSIAYSIFKGNEPSDHFEDVKANNWVSGRGVNKYTEILEWSLPINSYGQVLTLLYDEEGIAGWDEEDEISQECEPEWEPPTFHKSRRR
jgi:Zn-dependent peptidase ImmA (M78 family)